MQKSQRLSAPQTTAVTNTPARSPRLLPNKSRRYKREKHRATRRERVARCFKRRRRSFLRPRRVFTNAGCCRNNLSKLPSRGKPRRCSKCHSESHHNLNSDGGSAKSFYAVQSPTLVSRQCLNWCKRCLRISRCKRLLRVSRSEGSCWSSTRQGACWVAARSNATSAAAASASATTVAGVACSVAHAVHEAAAGK